MHPSIAVFDCDGTLWSGDAGADFFYWEIERGIVSHEVGSWAKRRYAEYKAGAVSGTNLRRDGHDESRSFRTFAMQQAAREFFDEVVSPPHLPRTPELTYKLTEQGCELWAVSSTNNWVVEVGAGKRFGIPRERILAAGVEIENGLATDRLIRVPTDELKVVAIHEVIGKPMEAVFGNSVHDQAMLEIAKLAVLCQSESGPGAGRAGAGLAGVPAGRCEGIAI